MTNFNTNLFSHFLSAYLTSSTNYSWSVQLLHIWIHHSPSKNHFISLVFSENDTFAYSVLKLDTSKIVKFLQAILPLHPINHHQDSASTISFIISSSISTAIILVNCKTHLIGLLIPYLFRLLPLPDTLPPIFQTLANTSFPEGLQRK